MMNQNYQNHTLQFIFVNHFTTTFVLDIKHDNPNFNGQILNHKIQQFLCCYYLIYFVVYF